MTTPTCARCGIAKTAENCNRNPRYLSGFQSYCKKCHKDSADASRRGNLPRHRATIKCWRAAHPAECRAIHRREWLKRYGLTPEMFDELAASQEGRCAICREPCTRFHVDHDHKTGRVRGLLCGPCNTGLGHFKDDPARLHRASCYLRGN